MSNLSNPQSNAPSKNESMMQGFRRLCEEADEHQEPAAVDHATPARIAALMQVLIPKLRSFG